MSSEFVIAFYVKDMKLGNMSEYRKAVIYDLLDNGWRYSKDTGGFWDEDKDDHQPEWKLPDIPSNERIKRALNIISKQAYGALNLEFNLLNNFEVGTLNIGFIKESQNWIEIIFSFDARVLYNKKYPKTIDELVKNVINPLWEITLAEVGYAGQPDGYLLTTPSLEDLENVKIPGYSTLLILGDKYIRKYGKETLISLPSVKTWELSREGLCIYIPDKTSNPDIESAFQRLLERGKSGENR